MRSRIATIFTIVLLVAGTGAAIAVGEGGSHGGPRGGAASGQYKPGKGCGKHHDKQCPPPKKHHHKPPKHGKSKRKPPKHKKTQKTHLPPLCTISKVGNLTVVTCP